MKFAIYTGLVFGVTAALLYAAIAPEKESDGSTYHPLPEQTHNPQKTIRLQR